MVFCDHMRCLALTLLFITPALFLSAQDVEAELTAIQAKKSALVAQIADLDTVIETIKFQKIIQDLKKIGLPSSSFIEHSAMILEYAEEHEQARWVAHMILPDIKEGTVFRSDDFRRDPKVLTGTAEQTDYFLTDTLAKGKIKYDGFGYDRGHLAASADFRWSKKALSQSYYYSNMSPQREEFNRESWAELENHLRKHVITHKTPLYVITAPVLNPDLKPISSRAKHNVSVPEQFVKAVYDPLNKMAIGFIMANQENVYPLDHYATTVDEVEELLGLNLFQSIDENIESNLDKASWFATKDSGNVDPIYQPSLPPQHFNTALAKKKIGKKVSVCGKVVATRYSKKEHLWMNLDRQFPDQLFSVFVRKENLVNFDTDLAEYYNNTEICVNGIVSKFSGKPGIELIDDNAIKIFLIKNHQEE